jgi:acyl-CoA thioesterase-1
MKHFIKIIVTITVTLLLFSCSVDNNLIENQTPKHYTYLALGDSYTIGQSVCETCRFPIQLKDSIGKYLNPTDTFQVKIIALTGWTTSDLKSAIAGDITGNEYDLVTLLIGVNNQYQHKPFSLYELEFPELVTMAIQRAKGDKKNLIIVSIPDYAFTPFGQGSPSISEGVFQYNEFAKNYCLANDITFVYTTDITRQGLLEPELVASDGLHPSGIAYSKFVERILPEAKAKITD